ncbi:uncharacterized protein CLUP02_13492 [Colletotrichum lupini]|uniref:Clr5 domain-containing protein n=1 Tax=Colletotrichum lupini TaxID=145971 RepID=A0A9Q8T4E4_9PEZI|nr:uncharacterized protein CLUP02_13492 [Colletotrichum lupini]UQC87971.1 hypothetical protein CLUP02_13492 [Colletotrichum lupini]
MVYDWDAHEKLCFQLYINEKSLSLFIHLCSPMVFVVPLAGRTARSTSGKAYPRFTTEPGLGPGPGPGPNPGKRAFQTQFRKWDFPSKQNPAHKNGRLVARVKELWERNLTQGEMLAVLREDGFDIKKRELIRVRTRNRWLLKAANGERSREGNGDEEEVVAGSGRRGASVVTIDDGFGSRGGEGVVTPGTPTDREMLGSSLPGEGEGDEDDDAVGGKESNGNNSSNNRRKRRRLRAWEAASSHGSQHSIAPRFPSETTLDDAKAILGLETDVYRQVRVTFAQLCEEAGIVKKTIAGPERWEAVKARLVRETPRLRAVMWDDEESGDANGNSNSNSNSSNNRSSNNHESKKLALDVICTDITKRARTLEKRLTLAEAKNILGVNPEEARDLRAAFERILKREGLGCKSEAGPAQWAELKAEWEAGSELVRRVLAPPGDEGDEGDGGASSVHAHAHAEKVRALDVLAKDVMKRLRDDASRREQPQKRGVTQQTQLVRDDAKRQEDVQAIQIRAQSAQPEMADALEDEDDLGGGQYVDASQVSVPPSMGLVPGSGASQQPQMLMPTVSMQVQAAAAADPMGHSAARILSSALLGQPDMGLETHHMGSSLLLAADAQAAFVDQQYAQQYAVAAAAAAQQQQQQQPVFHAPSSPLPQHQHPQPQPPSTTSIAVYLRLHPSSTFMATTTIWIATLSSHSVQELRHAAASKFPGAICLRLEGVLKDGKGGEMPLAIEQDGELAAYLAHLRGAAGGLGTPTFNVQLIPGWKT